MKTVFNLFRVFTTTVFPLIVVLTVQGLHAQKRDSLLQVIRSKAHDSDKVMAYNTLSREFLSNKPDTSLVILRSSLPMAQRCGSPKAYAFNCIYLANTFFSLGQFDSSIAWYNKGYDISRRAALRKSEAGALMGLANVYNTRGDYEKAVSFYTKGVAIQEAIADSSGMANSYTGLGVIFEQQAEYEKALEYQLKAIAIKERKKNKISLATSYNNVGIIYASMKKFDEALAYYTKALEIFETANNWSSLAMVSNNLGNLYSALHNKAQALSYKKKAYLLYQQIGDEYGAAAQLLNLGIEYSNYGLHDEAVKNMLKCEEVAARLQVDQLLLDSYHALYNEYNIMGNYHPALQYSMRYIDLNKKLFNAEKAQQIDELNAKYETDKQQKEIEILNKDKEINNLRLLEREHELNKQRVVIFSVIAAVILLVLLVVLLYNRIKLKQKTNEKLSAFNLQVQAQKELVEEKQKEILDSIHYAKRIQQSLLTSEKYIHKTLDKLRK